MTVANTGDLKQQQQQMSGRALSKSGFLAAALLAAGLAAAAAPSDDSLDPYPYPFLNPSLDRNERATDLINRLPLQTKVNLLQTANAPGIPGSGVAADPGWITLPNYTVETYTSVPCLHGLFGPINMTVSSPLSNPAPRSSVLVRLLCAAAVAVLRLLCGVAAAVLRLRRHVSQTNWCIRVGRCSLSPSPLRQVGIAASSTL